MIHLGTRRPPAVDHRMLFARTAEQARALLFNRPVPRERPPCRFELDVIEWAPCGNENKHVRTCVTHEKCTRGPNNGAVASCAKCKERVDPPGWTPPAPSPSVRTKPVRRPSAVRTAEPIRPRTPAARPAPELVIPTPLPPLPAFTRTSPFAVVTCAVGTKGRDMLDISGPFLRAYAERIGADFHVITDGGWKGYDLAAKFKIGQFFDAGVERLIFLDADALVKLTCPNLLEVVPRNAVAMHDDTPHADGMKRSIFARWQRQVIRDLRLSVPDAALPLVLNSGVIVASREHRAIFDPPTEPCLPNHIYEQDCISMRLLASGHPIHRLPWTLNYQWWTDPTMSRMAGAQVIHLSGLFRDHATRIKLMREIAAKLRGRP